MRTLYIACDGKEFENFDECKKYENGLKIDHADCIVMLDENGYELDYSKGIEELMHKCYYIKIGSDKDLKILKDSDTKYLLPERVGEFVYMYDDFKDKPWWRNINYEIQKAREKLRILEKVKKKFKEADKNNNSRR